MNPSEINEYHPNTKWNTSDNHLNPSEDNQRLLKITQSLTKTRTNGFSLFNTIPYDIQVQGCHCHGTETLD